MHRTFAPSPQPTAPRRSRSNLLLAEGAVHARHRKLIAPAFHFLRLKVGCAPRAEPAIRVCTCSSTLDGTQH